jgi:hypothetical protein
MLAVLLFMGSIVLACVYTFLKNLLRPRAAKRLPRTVKERVYGKHSSTLHSKNAISSGTKVEIRLNRKHRIN